MLYVISTPIGNLRDITLRAIDILKSVEYVVAEDTRTTGKLLKAYEIPKKPYISYNDYNSKKRIPHILELLNQGKDIALVSENGTPGISDPGYRLIKECVDKGIKVIPVPGATAFVPALVSSGLATDKFTFYGFLPKSKKKKADLFKKVRDDGTTGIFYESCHRIVKTLETLDEIYPESDCCVAREITKKFEEFLRGTPKNILNGLGSKPKGEFVLILGK